ncbi:MAG: PleD family two-component system response regulator [Candidatus Hodarchaeota archaeon]
MSLSVKPLILLVDDNQDILYNIKLLLEANNYKVITAISGKQAIELLSNLDLLPELIISDIMMPGINGYDFFEHVSHNVKWNHIPFIFLTAKSTPEDVRLGKMLGVDDYITKPFNEEDLLAIISGKILRNKDIKKINKKIKELLNSLSIDFRPSISEEQKKLVCILLVEWDDKIGPVLKDFYPKEKDFPIPIKTLGNQLFHAATSIYGHNNITKDQTILLNIENIKNKGYLFFDSYSKEGERYGEKQYMLSLIAPEINYLESLRIKTIFKEISENLKNNLYWDIEKYWKEILEILTTPQISNS